MTLRFFHNVWRATLVAFLPLGAVQSNEETAGPAGDPLYRHEETRALVALVKDAAELVRTQGEAAFREFSTPGSRWRQGETYIFVLDPSGNMVVHPDPELEKKNVLGLEDIKGKPIIRGLIDVATALPDKPEGWYHYEWPVPGAILPRWKSSYVRLVSDPAGQKYVVGSGVYNDRMEKSFVVDLVTSAIGQIESRGKAAFPLFRDPTGPFLAKDAYIFVIDFDGIELVNPAHPNLEGRKLLDVKDIHGKYVIREMFDLVQEGSGWVDYMWPKPGDNIPTQKSTYVTKARLGDQQLLVGCGIYLADAPRAARPLTQTTAPELVALVREAAEVLEASGEEAYADFRTSGSKWFHDDTYFFVWTMDGTRDFHAANPAIERQDVGGVKDILGRPWGKQFLEVARSPSGEGWVHYMYPEPGDIFPTWKSSFLKRVRFPTGKDHLVGCGIYNMKMDKTFVEDVVNRAAALVAKRGKDAFPELRDRIGPFFFMDAYVFVDTPDGIEVVNPGQPSLEGRRVSDLKDLNGKAVAREYIDTAMKQGSGWVEYEWFKPGDNKPARKKTFVRRVEFGPDTYIVGSGYYPESEQESPGRTLARTENPLHHRWSEISAESLLGNLMLRRFITGERMTVGLIELRRSAVATSHSHESEEMFCVLEGSVRFTVRGQETIVRAGEVMQIPSGITHKVEALEETRVLDIFSPIRQDWIEKTDIYLRQPAASTGGR